MRATSPSGSAAYTGRVAWSGELGYGVRAPEPTQSAADDDDPAADDIAVEPFDDGFHDHSHTGHQTGHDHDHGHDDPAQGAGH
jgi:NADH-quinone oxidoreductase subunit I